MPDWLRVAETAQIREGVAFALEVDGVELCLSVHDGEYFAIGDICPHQGDVHLSEGFLDGDTIECPLHQSCFSIRDGSVLAPPALEDVPSYPVRVEDGAILVDLGSADVGSPGPGSADVGRETGKGVRR